MLCCICNKFIVSCGIFCFMASGLGQSWIITGTTNITVCNFSVGHFSVPPDNCEWPTQRLFLFSQNLNFMIINNDRALWHWEDKNMPKISFLVISSEFSHVKCCFEHEISNQIIHHCCIIKQLTLYSQWLDLLLFMLELKYLLLSYSLFEAAVPAQCSQCLYITSF